MNEQAREKIIKLHRFYFEEVRPTAIQCESLISATPYPVHTEIRHAFDHISRAEICGLSEEDALKTLELGLLHFKRSIVDAWEIMVWSLSSKIDNVINNLQISMYYRAFRGHIYIELIESQKQSLKLFNEAREVKSENHVKAKELFQNAYNILDNALQKFFKQTSSEEYLRHRDKVNFIFWVIGLIISCGFGIIIALFFK